MSRLPDAKSDARQTSRERLIQAGGALARQSGFAGTGLDALAAAANLTSGAFYAQFRSKAELLDAIVSHDMTLMLSAFDGHSPVRMRKAMTRYLSLQHAENPGQGCSIPALGAEIARADIRTREKFEAHLLQLKAAFAELLGNDQQAWVMLSQAIGAQVIARAMASSDTRKDLLDTVLQDALAQMPAADAEPR
ncbi:MAG: TetR family transcriptional regulator [Pseudomonadota bacterium]